MTGKVRDHPAFRSGVKIDQNIAAKDGVEWTFSEIRFLVQIQLRNSTMCWISIFTFISPCRSSIPRSMKLCSKSAGSSAAFAMG